MDFFFNDHGLEKWIDFWHEIKGTEFVGTLYDFL